MFIWLLHVSLVIATWFGGNFHISTFFLFLYPNQVFSNTSHKLFIFNILALLYWSLSNSLSTVAAWCLHPRIVGELHLKSLSVMLTMTQHFCCETEKWWLLFPPIKSSFLKQTHPPNINVVNVGKLLLLPSSRSPDHRRKIRSVI